MAKSTNQSLLLLYSLATLGGSTTHLSTVGLKLDRINDSESEDDAYEELLTCDEGAESDENEEGIQVAFHGEPLIHVPAPDLLQQYMLPLAPETATKVVQHREDLTNSLTGKGDLIMVVGPKYVRDRMQIQECLRWVTTMEQAGVKLVLRANLSTKHGSSATYELSHGITQTRELLMDLAATVPILGQTSDLLSHYYFDDIMAMLMVGPSVCELQLHREIALGIPFPAGFACHDGDTEFLEITFRHKLQLCLDSIQLAANPHRFLSITKRGQVAAIGTTGNKDTFVVVNVENLCHEQISSMLDKTGKTPVMIEVGRLGNSEYDVKLAKVQHARAVGNVVGVVIESGTEYDLPTDYITNTPKFVLALAK